MCGGSIPDGLVQEQVLGATPVKSALEWRRMTSAMRSSPDFSASRVVPVHVDPRAVEHPENLCFPSSERVLAKSFSQEGHGEVLSLLQDAEARIEEWEAIEGVQAHASER